MDRLRFVTYLAPSLPRALFAAVVRHVGESTGRRVALDVETRTSAPPPGEPDPFTEGRADFGFLCAPGYLWLSGRTPPAVELLGAAPVFRDPRAGGQPVYFSDVVVRRDGPIARFADLAGRSWAYNDPCSASGYLNLLRALGEMGTDLGFFGAVRPSGSHLRSIRLVAAGRVDGAAIDSNALRLALRRDPALGDRIRVIESWGPYPIQPVVARVGLDPAVRARVAEALLGMHQQLAARRVLREFDVARFAPVGEATYAGERRALDGWTQRCAEARAEGATAEAVATAVATERVRARAAGGRRVRA